MLGLRLGRGARLRIGRIWVMVLLGCLRLHEETSLGKRRIRSSAVVLMLVRSHQIGRGRLGERSSRRWCWTECLEIVRLGRCIVFASYVLFPRG